MLKQPTAEMQEKIFIKTNKIGYIPQLSIQGPIVNPYPTTREVAYAMVSAGVEVYEITKDKKAVKLTLQNVYSKKKETKTETPIFKSGVTSAATKPINLDGVKNATGVNTVPVPEKTEEVKEEANIVELPVFEKEGNKNSNKQENNETQQVSSDNKNNGKHKNKK